MLCACDQSAALGTLTAAICAGSESMPDMGLGNPELGTADLLSSADLPPLPNYGSPGQLPGDPLEPLSDTGKSPALKYESLVGSPGDFLSLETPKGGMGAFAGKRTGCSTSTGLSGCLHTARHVPAVRNSKVPE